MPSPVRFWNRNRLGQWVDWSMSSLLERTLSNICWYPDLLEMIVAYRWVFFPFMIKGFPLGFYHRILGTRHSQLAQPGSFLPGQEKPRKGAVYPFSAPLSPLWKGPRAVCIGDGCESPTQRLTSGPLDESLN